MILRNQTPREEFSPAVGAAALIAGVTSETFTREAARLHHRVRKMRARIKLKLQQAEMRARQARLKLLAGATIANSDGEPKPMFMAILLAYGRGLSCEQIAAEFGWPLDHVKLWVEAGRPLWQISTGRQRRLDDRHCTSQLSIVPSSHEPAVSLRTPGAAAARQDPQKDRSRERRQPTEAADRGAGAVSQARVERGENRETLRVATGVCQGLAQSGVSERCGGEQILIDEATLKHTLNSYGLPRNSKIHLQQRFASAGTLDELKQEIQEELRRLDPWKEFRSGPVDQPRSTS